MVNWVAPEQAEQQRENQRLDMQRRLVIGYAQPVQPVRSNGSDKLDG